MDAHISDLIVEQTVKELTLALQSVYADEEPGIVKGGKLQDNPLKKRIYVCVHIGDPNDPQWVDRISGTRGDNVRGLEIPVFEFGGDAAESVMWWRCFLVEFGLFLPKSKENQDEARALANHIRGHIEGALHRSRGIPGLVDSFGEFSVRMLVRKSSASEGGGPPASYIWRGGVWFQVLTQRA